MYIFQEEILGPVTAVATFKNAEKAVAIANETLFGSYKKIRDWKEKQTG